MKAKDGAFIVKHVDVQRQVGSSDCGLMVIVFAVLRARPPHIELQPVKFEVSFLSCVQRGCLLPFHVLGATRHFGRAYFIYVMEEILVYCICHLFWKANNAHTLGKCAGSIEWYHQLSDKVDVIVFDSPM